MKRQVYQAAVCGVPGNYGVVFPDFMGCVSAGDTLAHATDMAHEALQLHVDGMTEDGDTMPEPGQYTLEAVAALMNDPEDPIEETWIALIDVAVDVPQPSDVVAFDMPVTLVQDLDEAGVDRRKFIIDATRRELLRLKKPA